MAGRSVWILCARALFWIAGTTCAFVLTLGSVGDPRVSADESSGDPAWRRSTVWDDGAAEFSAYQVRWQRYGRLYQGRAILVAVKEPWAPDLQVKADTPRADGFEVLKLNHIRDVATGIYTYHQMASAFFRRDSGKLEKLATMSSEACGVTTAVMQREQLETNSYFDGQGQRTMPWPTGAIPEDALPLALRDFVSGEAPATLLVFPSLLAGKLPALVARPYALSRRTEGEIVVPAGRFPAIVLELASSEEKLTFAFAAAAPHVLLSYHNSDGTDYQLAKVGRISYWNLHDPGAESWLPEDLRH